MRFSTLIKGDSWSETLDQLEAIRDMQTVDDIKLQYGCDLTREIPDLCTRTKELFEVVTDDNLRSKYVISTLKKIIRIMNYDFNGLMSVKMLKEHLAEIEDIGQDFETTLNNISECLGWCEDYAQTLWELSYLHLLEDFIGECSE